MQSTNNFEGNRWVQSPKGSLNYKYIALLWTVELKFWWIAKDGNIDAYVLFERGQADADIFAEVFPFAYTVNYLWLEMPYKRMIGQSHTKHL
jgi:hypothetical protein